MKFAELSAPNTTVEVALNVLAADSVTVVPEIELTVAPAPIPTPVTDMPVATPDNVDTTMSELPETRVAVVTKVTADVALKVLGTDRVTTLPKIAVTAAPAPIPGPKADLPTAMPVVVETVISLLPLTVDTPAIETLVLEKEFGGSSH